MKLKSAPTKLLIQLSLILLLTQTNSTFGANLNPSQIDAVPSRAKFYSLRLKPGQDFLVELTSWAKKNKIKAAALVTVVGSFKKVNLRYANQDNSTAQEGFFEIVSLVGTFNESSAHLHASVSNGKGETFGGHLVAGNIVYTTAEIVIADLEDSVFSREHDTASGWDELVIRKK